MVKLVRHTGECNHPDDDLTLPVRLELNMRPPSLMSVAFTSLYGGSEEVVARAHTVDEMRSWMHDHGLDSHPRLRRYRITDGDTVVDDLDMTK